MSGTLLILWTARIAFLLYAVALACWLIGKPRDARLAWTAGMFVFLSHVAAAFHFQHHWSHAAAYEETARQTAALFGIRSGSGLYLNYVFTAIWALDVIWLWTHAQRERWITIAVNAFMAFMFFNATVIFVSGSVRWLGIAVTVSLGILYLRFSRHQADHTQIDREHSAVVRNPPLR
jgi:hypothetical protein